MSAALAAPALAQDTPPKEADQPADTKAADTKSDANLDLAPSSIFAGWKGGVELGLGGSEGNAETFNMHAGANAERKTDRYTTKASFVYLRASTDGHVDKNRAELDARNDWTMDKGSPWRVFVQGTAEYDDFQDWQYRLTLFGGVGYAFIETERTTLVGRAGVGIREDLLGSDNRMHPEGLLGLDWSCKITQRQLITTTAEFYKDFLDLDDYRFKLKAEWSLLVDPESKLSLKVGAEDRFNSNPGPNTKSNDLDYFAVLVWSF
jgi:putative salt-induced outer membrane protein YdiY